MEGAHGGDLHWLAREESQVASGSRMAWFRSLQTSRMSGVDQSGIKMSYSFLIVDMDAVESLRFGLGFCLPLRKAGLAPCAYPAITSASLLYWVEFVIEKISS
jgi:hypothetical protein